MFEIHISENAVSVNSKISELSLGEDVLISSIVRNDKIILPKGNVHIKANDILFVLVQADKIDRINLVLNRCKNLDGPCNQL